MYRIVLNTSAATPFVFASKEQKRLALILQTFHLCGFLCKTPDSLVNSLQFLCGNTDTPIGRSMASDLRTLCYHKSTPEEKYLLVLPGDPCCNIDLEEMFCELDSVGMFVIPLERLYESHAEKPVLDCCTIEIYEVSDSLGRSYMNSRRGYKSFHHSACSFPTSWYYPIRA